MNRVTEGILFIIFSSSFNLLGNFLAIYGVAASSLLILHASRCSLCASRRRRLWTRLSSGGNSSPQTARPVAFSSAMVSWIISRLVVLVFGTLYPAYSSYKAVKTKDVREYVKWMMYWIIFALFTTVEVFTDMFLC
ncbi:hypothetical protein ILYODFUR_027215, partial [Ilyodon furcidens]